MRSKKKAKAVKPVQQEAPPSPVSTPSALPPPSPQPEAESPWSPVAFRASSPSNSISQSPTQPQKKAKTVTDLTVAQEEDMVLWLQENELLYNKKINAYKNYRKKDVLWESKAATMEKDVQMLKTGTGQFAHALPI